AATSNATLDYASTSEEDREFLGSLEEANQGIIGNLNEQTHDAQEESSRKAPVGKFETEDMNLFKERFHRLRPDQKWRLPSGAYAEDYLFREGSDMKKAFGPDWEDVSAKPEPPKLEKELADYLMTFNVTTIMDLQRALLKPYPHQDEFNSEKHADFKWIKDTVSLWLNLYTKRPSPFATTGLTEAYWRIHAWSCIDTLLDNIDDVHLIPGEGQALDSIARRNSDREPGPYKSPRKRAGSKTDGTLRTAHVPQTDWLVIEGKISGWKIPREMHDILRGRMRETNSESARKIQILGIVLSGNELVYGCTRSGHNYFAPQHIAIDNGFPERVMFQTPYSEKLYHSQRQARDGVDESIQAAQKSRRKSAGGMGQ
ncbi:hypothetical protein BGZ80_003935, partial [Entomortierella chlamydospora]